MLPLPDTQTEEDLEVVLSERTDSLYVVCRSWR